MDKYGIYYWKKQCFKDEIGLLPLQETHVFVATVRADSINEAYIFMQGEVWSPRGEARELIKALGLNHTSMSVYDIIYLYDTNEYFMVNGIGYKKLERMSKDINI